MTDNTGNRRGSGGRGGGRAPSGGRQQQAPRPSSNSPAPGNAKREISAPAPSQAQAQAQATTPVVQAPPAVSKPSASSSKPTVPTKVNHPRKDLLFQKVAIFVDAENIEMSSLRHHEGRTDYKKILDHVGDREIVRILYYKPIYKDISPEFEAFWASLGGEIKRPNKNADTFLVIDAVTMAEKIDVAIILGGDKDFLPLMWYLRSRGCRVEIWSWPETTSPEMKEAADYYHPLTEEFVIGKTRR